jgi:hypothetical protein
MKKLLPILMVAILALSACNPTTTTTTTDGDSTKIANADSANQIVVDPPKQDSNLAVVADSSVSADPSVKVDPNTDPGRKPNPDPIVTATRLTVSFISIGAGIDSKAKEKFIKFVAGFETRNKVKLASEIVGWGREGEVDFCYDLAALKPLQRAAFVQEAKAQVNGNELVKVMENKPCRKPR